MEKEIQIKTSDNHKIYGFLELPKAKTDKLVIFVHGFTGNCNEHIFFNGARYLKANDIATFRFNLYDSQKDARTFIDCDVETHVNDLRAVYDYFKEEYKKIYLIGHSMGGMVVLESKLDPAGIVLWDSSHGASSIDDDEYTYCKELDSYLLNWGLVYVVGRKMYEDKLQYPPAKELIDNVKCPLKIICAEKGVLAEGGKDYYRLAKEPKDFTIIKNAGHTFDEEGVEELLLKETLDWVNKF